jgi:predicted dehydrogenase
MEHAYAIRNQDYLGCDHETGYPHALYREFGIDEYDWIMDVSSLSPTITAVMSPSEASRTAANQICRERGDDPELFADFEPFLENGAFDAAIVASPTDVHPDAVLPLLERDIDVFCEKPLAATLPDHDRMIAADEASDGLLYPGFQRRLAPYYRGIKDRLDGVVGRLGTMSHTEVRDPFHITRPGVPGYRYSQARSGGALLEKNCHDFDLFNWYSGANPIRVSAFGGQHALCENTDIVDQATVNVQYDTGVIASLELCLYAGAGKQDIYDVRSKKTSEYRGSKGILRAPADPGVIEIDTRTEQSRVEIATAGSHGGDLFEVHRFLQCLRGEADPPVEPRAAKKAAAVALAAERSVEADGEPIEITEDYDLQS